MKIQADKASCDRARASHELYILNMFLFNLPAVAGALAYTIGGHPLLLVLVVVALLVSLLILAFIWWKARSLEGGSHWLVMLHWKQAAARSRLVLIGYGITGAIIGAGWLVAAGTADANMQVIIHTIFTRVGIVPALLLVLVTAILEGQSMHLANNAIAPRAWVKRFPPPADVVVVDEMNETGD